MKINIENYDTMTPEEKIAALEASYADGEKMKSALDKATSEAAAFKKQLRERMSEDEAKAAKDAEERAAIMAELEVLRHEKLVGTYVTSYMALGYDEKLAKATAEAMAKGDMATVFANQKTHADAREKALRAELLKQTPPPPAGSNPSGMKKEDFAKLSLAEKQKFATENPEQYAAFYKN